MVTKRNYCTPSGRLSSINRRPLYVMAIHHPIPSRFFAVKPESKTLVHQSFVANINANESLAINIPDNHSEPTGTLSLSDNRIDNLNKNPRKLKERCPSTSLDIFPNVDCSCPHTLDMVDAEVDLEIFCDLRSFSGLIPERFLSSLEIFANNNLLRTDIFSNNPGKKFLFSTTHCPSKNDLLDFRRFQDHASHSGPTKGFQVGSENTQETLVEKQRKRLVCCAVCGCYRWVEWGGIWTTTTFTLS